MDVSRRGGLRKRARQDSNLRKGEIRTVGRVSREATRACWGSGWGRTCTGSASAWMVGTQTQHTPAAEPLACGSGSRIRLEVGGRPGLCRRGGVADSAALPVAERGRRDRAVPKTRIGPAPRTIRSNISAYSAENSARGAGGPAQDPTCRDYLPTTRRGSLGRVIRSELSSPPRPAPPPGTYRRVRTTPAPCPPGAAVTTPRRTGRPSRGPLAAPRARGGSVRRPGAGSPRLRPARRPP
jgi:hypothetical protein